MTFWPQQNAKVAQLAERVYVLLLEEVVTSVNVDLAEEHRAE